MTTPHTPPVGRARAGKLGGLKTKAKHGSAHFKKIGRIGGLNKRKIALEFPKSL